MMRSSSRTLASAAADDGMKKCPRCWFAQRVCLCAEVPAIATQTRIVIVRHHLERFRSSNSGRLAHLALTNSEIVEHGGSGGPAPLRELDGAWLLFPEGEPLHAAPVPLPAKLVVLDATWSQARRMYRKLDVLRGLPLLRLPDDPMPRARLRESPGAGRVSTIEAIARALRLLEGEQAAAPLEQLFDVAVRRAQSTGRRLQL
jgi:DTW domain-containing protein YfiP